MLSAVICLLRFAIFYEWRFETVSVIGQDAVQHWVHKPDVVAIILLGEDTRLIIFSLTVRGRDKYPASK